MKALWNTFPEEDKPGWLTREQINEYEERMLGRANDARRMGVIDI